MDSKKSRIIIVDPSLKDNRGHHYALTRVIVSSALDSGYEVIVFSNASVNHNLEISGAKVKPVFSLSTYDHFKVSSKVNKISFKAKLRQYIISQLPESFIEPLKRIRNKLKKLLNRARVSPDNAPVLVKGSIDEELRAVMLSEKVTAQDHVLVHTSDAMMYRSILQIIQKPYPGGHPLYHLCTPYDIEIMPHSAKGMPVSRVINYLHLMSVIDRYVFLYAENELLAKSLSTDWGVDVATLDIPMMKNEAAGLTTRDENSVFRVVYLGAARDEKGFNLIPEVAEKVLALSADGPEIEFVIQCNAQIVGYNRKIKSSIEQLKEYPDSYVRLITEQQSMEDYYSTLDSADAVLLCYQQERYRVRGSGVATEAVAFGKNIIVTPGTYPEWLAGDAGIAASNSNQIATAIMTFAQNRETYLKKAKKRADWFSDKTRPEKYINKLIENVARAKNLSDATGIQEGQKLSKSTLVQVREMACNGSEEQDDMSLENKYNTRLLRADVAVDGYTLFVKQGGHFGSVTEE